MFIDKLHSGLGWQNGRQRCIYERKKKRKWKINGRKKLLGDRKAFFYLASMLKVRTKWLLKDLLADCYSMYQQTSSSNCSIQSLHSQKAKLDCTGNACSQWLHVYIAGLHAVLSCVPINWLLWNNLLSNHSIHLPILDWLVVILHERGYKLYCAKCYQMFLWNVGIPIPAADYRLRRFVNSRFSCTSTAEWS